MSSCGSNAVMETLCCWSITSWITLSSTPAHTPIRRCVKSFTPALFPVDSLLNYAPDFVVNWIDVKAVRLQQIWKFIAMTTISWDCSTFGVEAANDAQSAWVNTACRKDHSQKNLSNPILWYRNVYNQIASDVCETNNPVYKPKMNKLQPVLINLLVTAILNIKVSQGSVASRLRWGGIFPIIPLGNHCWVCGEIILKIGPNLAKLWARVECPVFWLTGYMSTRDHSSAIKRRITGQKITSVALPRNVCVKCHSDLQVTEDSTMTSSVRWDILLVLNAHNGLGRTTTAFSERRPITSHATAKSKSKFTPSPLASSLSPTASGLNLDFVSTF